MRCLSFFGHPCLCLQIPSFQGLGGIFTRWILAMPGTLRYCLSALFGRRVYDSPPPEASLLLASSGAAYVRFRRPPWRLFLAIARRSLREASLRLASQKQASCLLLPGPPTFASAALHGGFSSLSLGTLFGRRVLRLALQKQASCLLLPGRLRSFSPPSVAAFPRYRSALSSGGESTTRLPPLYRVAKMLT